MSPSGRRGRRTTGRQYHERPVHTFGCRSQRLFLLVVEANPVSFCVDVLRSGKRIPCRSPQALSSEAKFFEQFAAHCSGSSNHKPEIKSSMLIVYTFPGDDRREGCMSAAPPIVDG